MGSQSLSREWLDFAHMDLSSAEFLLGMHPLPVEIICYHCEQAAEKFLKAVLIYYGVEAPKTHDLVLLCKLCVQLDQSWEQMIDACVDCPLMAYRSDTPPIWNSMRAMYQVR